MISLIEGCGHARAHSGLNLKGRASTLISMWSLPWVQSRAQVPMVENDR